MSGEAEAARPEDVTARFTGLAGLYARARPDYPAEAIDFILERCGLDATCRLVDVGCGTGISSRIFAGRGLRVVGIEPNDDMRAEAEAVPFEEGTTRPEYRVGRAEATGVAAGWADAVVAAQAFHWFDADAALREFRRILKPHGWAILMWNERSDVDAFSAGYGRILAATPDGVAIQHKRMTAGRILLEHPFFRDGRRDVFCHEQVLDEQGLIGRALSASYAPRRPDAVAEFIASLRSLFASHHCDGQVTLRYETAVYTAHVVD
ncbi:MAG: class I SAM-dependent methyltransferase [Planctomycetes bacterium]|nr:class I SAM-dependent methyltransferase [Planctomycetota bacterium]